jgi:hypothetical protein
VEETSDARLIQLIAESAAGAGSADPTAEQAAAELRRRHLPAALAYARVCGRDSDAAGELAEQAWEEALRQMRQGAGPAESWRHPLLLLVAEIAADWAADGSPGGLWVRLAPAFVAWSDERGNATGDDERTWDSGDGSGVEGADSGGGDGGTAGRGSATQIAIAYRGLSERTRAILWHTLVEREREAKTAALLGVEPGGVAAAGDRALDALRVAYLEEHAHRGGESCHAFARMIEVAARGSGGRRNADLDGHLAGCRTCTAALTDLTALDRRPGVALAEAVLPWGGPAYVAARLSDDADIAQQPTMTVVPASTGTRARVLLAAAALIAVTAIAAALVAHPDSGAPAVSGPAPASPAPSRGSPGPARTIVTTKPTATRTTTAPAPAPAPAPERHRAPARRRTPPGDTYVQLVNAGSGLCLDIDDSELEAGADVVTRKCSAAALQKWFLDSAGRLHNSADAALCLDSRGDIDEGVGISSCRAPTGGDDRNLRFRVAADRSIRPLIAPDHAITSRDLLPGLRVRFEIADGRLEQRWQRGATAVRPA